MLEIGDGGTKLGGEPERRGGLRSPEAMAVVVALVVILALVM